MPAENGAGLRGDLIVLTGCAVCAIGYVAGGSVSATFGATATTLWGLITAMFVTVPLGIFLGTGIGGKIDAGETFTFLLQSCTVRGCQAALEITPPMRETLSKGQRLLIGFKPNAQANTVTIPVSLDGFTDGLASLPMK